MDENLILYCGLCKYLIPKEREQKKGERHHCLKYDKRLRHLGHHPEIPRLPECDEPLRPYSPHQTGVDPAAGPDITVKSFWKDGKIIEIHRYKKG